MAMRVHVDETSCGPLCQHPACWHSNTRQDKGFPRLRPRPPSPPDIELDLPTLKICNMLEDYGDDAGDKFPTRFSGKPAHDRNDPFSEFHKPIRTQSIKVTRAPQPSPKSGTNTLQGPVSSFKVVEVQEVFDPVDLQGTWDDTFVPKSYYVWVPNQKKKRRKQKQMSKSEDKSGGGHRRDKVGVKDMTESMVPKEIENLRLTSRKKRAQTKSPGLMRPYTMSPRTMASTRMDFDHEGNSRYGQISVPVPSRLSGWNTPGQSMYLRPGIISRGTSGVLPPPIKAGKSLCDSSCHCDLKPKSNQVACAQCGPGCLFEYDPLHQLLYDRESISELLDLPRDILVQVLENTRQSDLMSREKIREIIRRFMPPQFERGNTNISLASQDLLQQKKLNLHEGNKNVRQPHLMETKPVFYLDDDIIDDDEIEDEDLQRPGSPYGSLKDLYFGGTGTSREFNRYKKPLPAIPGTGRAISAGGEGVSTKIPSISLGLPELPSGIRQTKAFTYNKKADLDFTLGSAGGSSTRKTPCSRRDTHCTTDYREVRGFGLPLRMNGSRDKAPVPTPPTSVRSTEPPGSDHGTTIRVNVPSQASVRSEHGSDRRRDSCSTTTPEPLHAVSPTFSTRVPKAPATTPATNQPPSPTKSAPLMRDTTDSTAVNTPQEWPPREKSSSPLQILRAPVNTPGSIMQEAMGLGTIHETVPDESGDQSHPVSRGRSVRFEIPEVPPPPSSPQLSDDEPKDLSRNAVTVNTNIPQETPSVSTNKPMSGATLRTDANTVNTSTLIAENSFIRSQAAPIREYSMVSSPEPWPQVVEADYEAAPVPSPITTGQDSPITLATTDQLESQSDDKSFDKAHIEREPIIVPSPDKDSEHEYINKTDGHTDAVKKLMEDSRKAESPAPPPPSPEPKQDSTLSTGKKSKVMTPLMEENETPHGDKDDSEMSVLQIAPKGTRHGTKKLNNRQIDTFQNIDIPATFDVEKETTTSQSMPLLTEPTATETILEEPETDLVEGGEGNKVARDMAISVQSTLANRTISEQAHSDISSSMVEPAISQASQAPALSEDFSERQENSELLGDWTGVVVGSEGQDTMGMLSSEKQDQELDMTEEGGDHEGFKEDLRQEYEKLRQETEITEQEETTETNEVTE